MKDYRTFTVFCGPKRVGYGDRAEAILAAREWAERKGEEGLLYFDDSTGRQVDFNLREKVTPEPEGPARGRPKLGVVPREVSLLPRHWEWLEEQPSGASAAMRRLVEAAMRKPAERAKLARQAAGRFLTAVAGNRPGFEEAMRALYAGEEDRFQELTAKWPRDIREHAEYLAGWAI